MKKIFKNSWQFFAVLLLFTVLAFSSRFYHLNQPQEVVFDEFHFFHFVADYEKGEYFFDIHPPLGKLILWSNAKLYGIEEFGKKAEEEKKFRDEYVERERELSKKIQLLKQQEKTEEEISILTDKYNALVQAYQTVQAKPFETYTIGTPYDDSLNIWGIRSVPAFFGALLVPVLFGLVFFITRSYLGASLAAVLVLFEPSLIVESRYVLMDSLLLFCMLAAVFFLFVHHKNSLWRYWIAVSIFATLAVSIKWTGLSVVGLAGLFLLIELWSAKGWNFKKFFAKAAVFWMILLSIYIASFWMHFSVLPKSGAGDVYHSTAFKQTLAGDNAKPDILQPKTFWTNPSGEKFLPKRFDAIEKKVETIQEDGTVNITTEIIPGAINWESSKLYGKFFELNRVMGDRNASITTEHPFSSTVKDWIQGKKYIFYWQGDQLSLERNLRKEISAARKEKNTFCKNTSGVCNTTLQDENIDRLKNQLSEVKTLPSTEKNLKTEVHLFTNPFVWIAVSFSVFLLSVALVVTVFRIAWYKFLSSRGVGSVVSSPVPKGEVFVFTMLLIAVFSNVLPYLLVTRPAFLYHALPAFLIGVVSLGVIFARYVTNIWLGIGIFIAVLAGLLVFTYLQYPIIYGIPFLQSTENILFFWR